MTSTQKPQASTIHYTEIDADGEPLGAPTTLTVTLPLNFRDAVDRGTIFALLGIEVGAGIINSFPWGDSMNVATADGRTFNVWQDEA